MSTEKVVIEENTSLQSVGQLETSASSHTAASADVATEPKKDEQKEEEEGSALAGFIFLAIIGVAIWALVHFNPSHDKHREAISKAVVENMLDGYTMDYAGIASLKYGSIGICSWTYVRRGGKFYIGSVGACGYVLPLM